MDKLAAVDRRTGPGYETVTRANLAAVAAKGAGDPAAEPVRRLRRSVELKHQNDSSTADHDLRLDCHVGLHPIMRSVCWTTSLNTGLPRRLRSTARHWARRS